MTGCKFNRLCILITFVIFTQVLVLLVWINGTKHDSVSAINRLHNDVSDTHNQLLSQNRNVYQTQRVAVLIPYLGDNLPLWFNTFALSASSTESLFDWFIFITEAPLRPVPDNVHLIRMSRQEIYRRFASLDYDEHNASISTSGESQSFIQYSFQCLIEEHPYVLVEFKSTLGIVFSDLIETYSHWAYADMDVLAGRVDMHVSQEHLKKFDVLSFSFGDNYRLYLRGQLTILRNTHVTNHMWRQCPHLQDVGSRLRRAYGDKENNEGNHAQGKVLPFNWHFQSAEGCFSRVVMDASNVSVLFLSSQLSDAFRGTRGEKESLLAGRAVLRCHERGLDLAPEGGDGGEMKRYLSCYLDRRDKPSTEELFILQTIPNPERQLNRVTGSCSYWIEPQYDVCVSDVPAIANVLKDSNNIISQHTVQSYQLPSGSACREAAIVHFQGWKKQYTAFTTRPPSADAHVMLVTDSGFIPLRLLGGELPSFGEQYAARDLRAGRLTPQTLTSRGDSSTKIVTESKKPLVSSYCSAYADNLKSCLCFIPLDHITVAQRAVRPATHTDITLISAGWAEDFISGAMDDMLRGWDGPKVLVLATTSDDIFHSTLIRVNADPSLSIILVRMGDCAQHLHSDSSTTSLLPDNTLLNIGMDAAGTDLVCVVPSEMTTRGRFSSLSEGVKLSHRLREMLLETDYALQRESNLFSLYPPVSALVVPAFSSQSASSSRLAAPSPWRPVCGQDQPDSLMPSYEEISGDGRGVPMTFNAQAFLQERTSMLPVVFNVSAGPHGRDFVRFPEEFSGQGCFGASILRVLTGAGYSLNWAVGEVHVEMQSESDVDVRSGSTQCGCVSRLSGSQGEGTRSDSLQDMAGRINRFFLRAVELRNKGVGSVYSGKKFEESFERNEK